MKNEYIVIGSFKDDALIQMLQISKKLNKGLLNGERRDDTAVLCVRIGL
jgi:hypothetical protein